jgi:RHS repeat-associated protein
MADLDTDPSVPPGTQAETIERLAQQVRSSYAQAGADDKTVSLVREYVDAVIGAGYESQLNNLPYLDDLVLATLNLGVSDQQITDAVASRLNDLATGKGCASSSPTQRNVQTGSDPIEMFSGQFLQEATDLVINGAGMDFAFRRSYKSQAVYNGPLGTRWDHVYNLYLRQLGNNLICSSGELREDIYTRHPLFGTAGFDYWVPPDGQNGIIEENGTSFTWRTPGGVRYLYQQDAGDPLFHRIQRIQDRFGNYLAFRYQNNLLQRVEINHPARFVILDYDTLERIFALHDHTGRQWTYAYDDYGDLVSVTSPPTTRYPRGLTTSYEYSSSEYSAPLQHNLTRIIDPAGQLYLENEYGADPGLLNFNRIVRQRQGNGEYFFEYETVVSEFEYDYNDSEKPAIQVNQTLRNGQMVHFIYNTFGNLLFQEEYICQDGLRRLVQWRYRYNRDGALVGVITPEGTVTQYYYGRDDYLWVHNITDEEVATHDSLTTSARMAFGNLLAVVRRDKRYDFAQMNLNRGVWGDFFPDILAALDPADVVVKNTYEPDYQQIHTISDPRFTARADPRFAEAPSYTQHLTRYEYSAMPRKTLRRIRYPDTTFPVPLPNGTVGLTNISEEFLQYDTRGRLERMEDPEGNVTENRYFPGGPAAIKEGYLHEIARDMNSLNLVTVFEVNDLGIVTSVINPRQVQTRQTVNELNQVIETVSGGPGYRTRSFFDKNGLLERQERDNLDDVGQPSPDGDEVKTYKYDEQNNLVRETRGGNDLTQHHVTLHRYDGSDKRIETILPLVNNIRFEYDERLLPKATIRGASSTIASTTRMLYDGDGRKIAVIDGRGNISRFTYDTFNRVVSATDALGNVQQNEYDKLGNVTVMRFFERKAAGTYHLLRRGEFVYDERANRIREINYLFVLPIPTADIEQSPDAEFITAQNQGLITQVETQFFYDKNKRLFRVVNAKGQKVVYEYDGINRQIAEYDNADNYILTFFDKNSNVIRVDRHELVRNLRTGKVIREDVFSTVNEYDALDRRIATMDGLGNRTTFTYDSRYNLASSSDPLGNVKRYKYDVFNRKVREIVEMTQTGLGGGTRLQDIVTQFIYDDNDCLTSIVDAKGNTTKFAYDELNRQYQTTYVDGSHIHLSFDADDNVIVRRDNSGLRMLYYIDPLSRRTRMDLDKTGLNPLFPYPAGAESYEAYAYDGLGRVLQYKNDFCETNSKPDSFGRVYDEQINFTTPYPAPGGAQKLSRSFDVVSNRTDVTYPSGRAIHYDYDSLNRVAKITNSAKGAGYPGSATFPAHYDIAGYEYRGLRLAKATYGNEAGYHLAYDGAGRLISTRHISSRKTLLNIQQLFDSAGNRRFQSDRPKVGARPNGVTYTYDSLYRLTKYERKPLAAINPAQFEPPNAPLSLAAMTGQQVINTAIGSLAQNPLDYTYKYDALGNREEEKQPGQPATLYIPNSLNQYQNVDGTQFQYDLNGNLMDDGNLLYRYNYRNQLVQVLQKATSNELLRLLYDATGRLIVIREAGQVIHLINDGLNVVEEYNGSNVTRQYVYENGIDRRCQLVSGGEEWWYHYEILRTPRLLSNSVGQVPIIARYEYNLFGMLLGPVGQSNPYYFTGKRLFASANLYDSRTRQYSPILGRFLQRDPKGTVDGPNLYTYAGNNPITFIDLIGTEKAAGASHSLSPKEQAAWDAAEAAKFSDESVDRLIAVYVESHIPEGNLLNRDVAERLATVRGSAFASHWNQGNYGYALGNLPLALIESFGAAMFGYSVGETARNIAEMYTLSAVLGGGVGLSKMIAARPSAYVPLFESTMTDIPTKTAYTNLDVRMFNQGTEVELAALQKTEYFRNLPLEEQARLSRTVRNAATGEARSMMSSGGVVTEPISGLEQWVGKTLAERDAAIYGPGGRTVENLNRYNLNKLVRLRNATGDPRPITHEDLLRAQIEGATKPNAEVNTAMGIKR